MKSIKFPLRRDDLSVRDSSNKLIMTFFSDDTYEGDLEVHLLIEDAVDMLNEVHHYA